MKLYYGIDSVIEVAHIAFNGNQVIFVTMDGVTDTMLIAAIRYITAI